jgi:hypothetical protein
MIVKVDRELHQIVFTPEGFRDLFSTIWLLKKPLSLFDWWIKSSFKFPLENVKHVVSLGSQNHLVVFKEPLNLSFEAQSVDPEILSASQFNDSWLFRFHVSQSLKMLSWSPLSLLVIWSFVASLCLSALMLGLDERVQKLCASCSPEQMKSFVGVWNQTYFFWLFVLVAAPIWFWIRHIKRSTMNFVFDRKLKVQWLFVGAFLVSYYFNQSKGYFDQLQELFALGLSTSFVLFGL